MTQIAIHDSADNTARLRNYLMDRTIDLVLKSGEWWDEVTVTQVSSGWLYVRMPEFHGGHTAQYRLSDIDEITIQS